LMTKRERDQHRDVPTRPALEASLPDDPDTLRELAAQALVDKAVLAQELNDTKLQKLGEPSSSGSIATDQSPGRHTFLSIAPSGSSVYEWLESFHPCWMLMPSSVEDARS